MSDHIGENIHALRVDKGLSQDELAAVAGVSQTTVSNWEIGLTAPRASSVNAILEAFSDLTADDIWSDETGYARKVLRRNADTPGSSWVNVPLYGSIAAGKAIEMLPIDDVYAIPRSVHNRYPRAFLLKVVGESMNRCLPNGTYALVDPTAEVIDGKVYAVCIGSSDATVKRVKLRESGIELAPDSYDPSFISAVFDRASQTETVSIIGRVVWYCLPPDFEL